MARSGERKRKSTSTSTTSTSTSTSSSSTSTLTPSVPETPTSTPPPTTTVTNTPLEDSIQSPKKFKSNNGQLTTNSNSPYQGRLTLVGSTLVAKDLPETILISRKGEKELIETPKTFIQLKNICKEMYQNSANQNVDILFSDLSNYQIKDEITYQKFLITSNRNVLICYFEGERVLDNGSEEILVDVTPSKNILLKAGTSEYNFPNAIAEFIDNSIQAVRLNPPGKRDIKVLIGRPNSDLKTTSVRIWDNGCGMDKDALQRWATMGLSQADLLDVNGNETHGEGKSPIDNRQLMHSSINGSNEKATGLISRFGVGGKKAAFYLGTEVVVNTKVCGNEWVNQAKISLEILNSTGDQEWKIPIVIREPTTSEKRHDQFTEVIINNVNMSPENYQSIMEVLGRDLAHIYYYYLHDVGEQNHFTLGDNNSPLKKQKTITSASQANGTKKTSASQQQLDEIALEEEEEEEEEDDYDDDYDDQTYQPPSATPALPGSRSTRYRINFINDKKNSYNLMLNDKDLSDVDDCIESLYIKQGRRFKIFDFSIPIKDGPTGITNSAKVVCHLRYFPFINEHETMPIPTKLLQDSPELDLKTCPLSLRKPGFEVFWNGRLISEAHIDRLGFMTTGTIDGSKIEEKWVQRVKGAIFLTSHFPVTHNKMHIIKESPVFDLLDQPAAGGKVAKLEWRRWLLQCHKLDQDIQFKGAKYDTITNKTNCESITIRGLAVAVEDPVQIARLQKGVVKSIYFIGRPDFRASDFYVELDKLHYKQLPLESFLCSKISKKFSKNQYSSLISACKKRLPSKIKFFEGDKANLPKESYFAGEKIKWVSCTLMDSQNPPKEVERKIIEEESYKIMFSVIYQPTSEIVHKIETSVFYESSRVSFGDIDCFKRTGPYSLIFECSDKSVKKASYFVSVVAGKPTSIKATLEGIEDIKQHRVSIGQQLPPLLVSLIDNDGNLVSINQIPKKLQFKAYSLEDQEEEESSVTQNKDKMETDNNREFSLSKPTTVELVDNQIIVKGLTLTEAELNDESELLITIQIIMDEFKLRLSPFTLVSGEPVTMTFTEQLTFLDSSKGQIKANIEDLDGYMNLTYLPHFYVFVNDKDGNICRLPSKKPTSTVTGSTQTTRGRKPKHQVQQASTLSENPPYYIMVRSDSFDEPIYYVCDDKGCFSLCTYAITGITKNSRITPPPTAILINEKVEKDFEADEPTLPTTKGKKKSPQTSNSYSIAIVDFTLFKDMAELFTVSQKIKILPSFKPSYITLHPLTDIIEVDIDSFTTQASAEINFGIKILSAGGGNRGPFILNSLIGSVQPGWSPKTIEFQMNSTATGSNSAGNMILLPTIVADRNTRFNRYNITVDIPLGKQSAKEFSSMVENKDLVITLKKDFTIQTVGGAPSYFVCNLGRGVGSARCDSEITLEIGLNDRRHNPVAPNNLKSSKPIEPFFELSYQQGHTSQIPCFIKSQSIGEFDVDKNIYPCKVTVVGFGKLSVRVIDKSQQISECSMNFDCIEGRAAQLCVNGSNKATIQCSGGQLLDEITFLVCDTQGNPTRSITGVDTDLEWIDNNSPSSVPIEIKHRVKISKGEGKLSNLEVKTNAEEGTYVLRVKPKQLDIQEALVSFVVRGKYSIVLLGSENLRITPSNPTTTLSVMLLNPEKAPMVVPKETMKLLTVNKTYPCSEITFPDDDETKPVYLFNGVTFPKKAGPTNVTFTHNVRGSKNTKIQMEQILIIHPDFPNKLSICGQIKFSPTTSTLGQKIGIIATDTFDNTVVVEGSIRVSIEISPNHPNAGSSNSKCVLPTFVSGSVYLEEPFKAMDGEATFEELKLRDSIGTSGPFQLVFTPHIPSIPTIEPLRIEFFYQNQKESLDKKVKLQQQRVTLSNEINEIDQELDEIKGQQSKILNEYTNSKHQADEIFNHLTSLIPNLSPEAKTNPETIKKLITQTSQEIEELSNRSLRRTPYPSNSTSRELLDISRSTNDSGIVGVIMDLLFVEDDRLAQCLANFLKSKMEGVLFQNKQTFQHYYDIYNSKPTQPVYFVSLDTLIPYTPKKRYQNGSQHNHQPQPIPPNQLDIQTYDGAPTSGFVGFVVNKVQLREKHEFLRPTLCFTLFKEMMVFETLKQAMSYKNYAATKKFLTPPIICLENGEYLDSSGFVEIGRNPNSRNWHQNLGQLPSNETHEFAQLKAKKNVLEEYRIIKHKMHSNKKGVEVQDYMNKIDSLKQQKKEKSAQLLQVTNEISNL
ncbi:hypothetical protein RB653_003082 [Dictyostelium firmibasis]|uniref:SMCHD1 ribosomal S5 domain-containing protein n=1 Tax=Dictyostelium firmibasis TaxID=79012 RepID=A0AAN7TRP5_9MYCE